jgi:hypothetical protein
MTTKKKKNETEKGLEDEKEEAEIVGDAGRYVTVIDGKESRFRYFVEAL